MKCGIFVHVHVLVAEIHNVVKSDLSLWFSWQMQQLAREYTDEFHVENECELSTCTDSAVETAESRVLPIQPPVTQCCVATCHQGSVLSF